MTNPEFKVTVTHSATDYDYENRVFSDIRVKLRENNFATARLTLTNEDSRYYDSLIDRLDVIKIYARDQDESSYTQMFGGTIRQANPIKTKDGALMQLMCKGYGAAFDVTHCNADYGLESSNHSLTSIQDIARDLVDNYVNKSFGGAATGYAITRTNYVSDLIAATNLTYVNNPYTKNIDVLAKLCQITTAVRAGSAGAHWIVTPDKELRVEYIGTGQVGWTQWWDSSNTQAGSTITEGVDFTDYHVYDRTEEFANNCVIYTDFRKPGYDYFTEDSLAIASWQEDGVLTPNTKEWSATHIVGSHSLHIETDSGVGQAVVYYPAVGMNWDVDKWGSEKRPARLCFYFQKDSHINEANCLFGLFTTTYNVNYYYTNFMDATDPDDEWIYRELPIGTYAGQDMKEREYNWVNHGGGAESWNDIDGFVIDLGDDGNNADFYIDDLHFAGQICRSAYNSTSIGNVDEYQKVFLSRTAMDDTGIASDDAGVAAQYAYAELLRRQKLPVTIKFTVPMQPRMLAGQELHCHACETATSGTYEIDSTMRILEVEHIVSRDGYFSAVMATDDLLNTFPVSVVDQYRLLTEYLLLNNREAMDIRASGEVDLLVPILSKDYP